ncbi:MAG: sulfotransferase [Fuerstiella sp.]
MHGDFCNVGVSLTPRAPKCCFGTSSRTPFCFHCGMTAEISKADRSIMQVHFIVGMSRAGTTWMAKTLNSHPDVACFGETAFWGRYFVEPNKNGTYDREKQEAVLKRHLLCPDSTAPSGTGSDEQPGCLSRDTVVGFTERLKGNFEALPEVATVAETFAAFVDAIAESEGKSIAVEKTPHHLHWIGRIKQHLPEAKFIIQVRDPYDFMLSYKHQGDRMAEQAKRHFQRLYHPIACAFVWRSYAKATRKILSDYPDDTVLVDFSSLKKNREETLGSVQKTLGLSPVDLSDNVPPDYSSFPSGKRPELEMVDIFWVNLIAGGEMKRMQSQRRSQASSWGMVARSVLSFPFWAIQIMLSLRRQVESPVRYMMKILRPA